MDTPLECTASGRCTGSNRAVSILVLVNSTLRKVYGIISLGYGLISFSASDKKDTIKKIVETLEKWKGTKIDVELLLESKIQLITGEKAENLMLYPMQKWDYAEPLLELLVEIKRLLESETCKFLIVVGYSFNNIAINDGDFDRVDFLVRWNP